MRGTRYKWSRDRLVTRAFVSLVAILDLSGCNDGFNVVWFPGEPMVLSISNHIPINQATLNSGNDLELIVDTLAPVTAIPDGSASGSKTATLRLREAFTSPVTRVVLDGVEVYTFDSNPLYAALSAGNWGENERFQGTLGADILRHFSVTIAYDDGLLRPGALRDHALDSATSEDIVGSITFDDGLFDSADEIAEECQLAGFLGENPVASPLCNAIFSTPRLGGGRIRLNGSDRTIAPTRLLLPLCLGGNISALEQSVFSLSATGVPTRAALATGLSRSVIAQSAVERLIAVGVGTPLEDEEGVALFRVPSLAVVSNVEEDLGACGEFARRLRLLWATRDGETLPDDRARRGAALAILAESIDFTIVDDVASLWQGLRSEIAGQGPVVDVLLGGNALRRFRIQLDYPGDRTIFECNPENATGICWTVPHCREDDRPICSA